MNSSHAEVRREGGDVKDSAIYSNLPVYRDCYAGALEFAKMRSELSRDTRYTIAQDLSRVLVDMMVTIYRANASRNDKARFIAELRRQAVEVQIYFSPTFQEKVAQPSSCFIIHDPKMREVFAAEFRDRVVHHLFYNYTHKLFERTFIADYYSCIEGRGTHYGVARLKCAGLDA